MEQVYVYHATPVKNKQSIEKYGLLLNQEPTQKDTFYVEDQLFFTFVSANKALDFVEEMLKDQNLSSELVVYRIPIEYFDVQYVDFDYNVNCVNEDHIKSFSYKKNVPPEVLELVPLNQTCRDYSINKLLGADNPVANEIAEKLIDIWEEEIAWMYETDDFITEDIPFEM